MKTKPRIVRGSDGRWVLFVVLLAGYRLSAPVGSNAARLEVCYSYEQWNDSLVALERLYRTGLVLRDRG